MQNKLSAVPSSGLQSAGGEAGSHQRILTAWFQPTPLKNDGVNVSWEDDIPNGKGISQENMKVSWDYYSKYMESHTIHVPNHQPVINYFPTNIALCTCFFWILRIKTLVP